MNELKEKNSYNNQIMDDILTIFGDIFPANNIGDNALSRLLQLCNIRKQKIDKGQWKNFQECAFNSVLAEYPECKKVFDLVVSKNMTQQHQHNEVFSNYKDFINHMKE